MSTAVSFKKFQILKEMAVGGMGTIYLARVAEGPALGRVVVLKCVSEEHSQNPEYRKYFISEIKAMLGLSHPNIVTMLDTGEENDILYITLEWIEGRSLRQILTALGKTAEVSMTPAIATAIAIEACQGFHYAHTFVDRTTNRTVPIIHRDISPTNLLVDFTGHVKIIDFGISKALHPESHSQRTQKMGKHGYMAPEQFKGESVDARTDVFSLGVVYWELLTGTRLFSGKNEAEIVWKLTSNDFHIAPPSKFIPGLSPLIDVAVMRALARNRSHRHESMLDFAKALLKPLRELDPNFSPESIGRFLRPLFADEQRRDREELQFLCAQPISSDLTRVGGVHIAQDKPNGKPVRMEPTREEDEAEMERSQKVELADSYPAAKRSANGVHEFGMPRRLEAIDALKATHLQVDESPTLPHKAASPPPKTDAVPLAAKKPHSSIQSPVQPAYQALGSRESAADPGKTSTFKKYAGIAAGVAASLFLIQHIDDLKKMLGAADADKKEVVYMGPTADIQLIVIPPTDRYTVRIGDRVVGVGLKTLKIPYEKSVQVSIEQSRYLPFKKDFFIQAGTAPQTLQAKLTPEHRGAISVTANLSAEVSIEGGELSWTLATPIDSLEVPAGEYKVTIRNRWMQYESVQNVLVRKGSAPRITATIVKGDRAPAAVQGN